MTMVIGLLTVASHVLAGHLEQESWFCEGGDVVYEDSGGDHHFWQECTSGFICSESDGDADCVPNITDPDDGSEPVTPIQPPSAPVTGCGNPSDPDDDDDGVLDPNDRAPCVPEDDDDCNDFDGVPDPPSECQTGYPSPFSYSYPTPSGPISSQTYYVCNFPSRSCSATTTPIAGSYGDINSCNRACNPVTPTATPFTPVPARATLSGPNAGFVGGVLHFRGVAFAPNLSFFSIIKEDSGQYETLTSRQCQGDSCELDLDFVPEPDDLGNIRLFVVADECSGNPNRGPSWVDCDPTSDYIDIFVTEPEVSDYPPTAAISGPTQGNVGDRLNFTTLTSGLVDQVGVWRARGDSNLSNASSWTEINSGIWVPNESEVGDWVVVVNAFGSGGQCSGNPGRNPEIWSECSSDETDLVRVNISAPTITASGSQTCTPGQVLGICRDEENPNAFGENTCVNNPDGSTRESCELQYCNNGGSLPDCRPPTAQDTAPQSICNLGDTLGSCDEGLAYGLNRCVYDVASRTAMVRCIPTGCSNGGNPPECLEPISDSNMAAPATQTGPNPEIESLATFINGSVGNIESLEVISGSSIYFQVFVSANLTEYACRWNYGDARGDVTEDCISEPGVYPPGDHTISVYVVNRAGQESQRKTISFKIKAPPSIESLETLINGQKVNLTAITLTAPQKVTFVANVPTDLGSDFACRWDFGTGFEGLDKCEIAKTFEAGIRTVSVFIVNNSGQESDRKTVTFKLDSPPVPTQVQQQEVTSTTTVTESFNCYARLTCGKDKDGTLTGYGTKTWFEEGLNSTGNCPQLERIYAPADCPLGEFEPKEDSKFTGEKLTLEKNRELLETKLEDVVIAPQCEHQEYKDQYQCSKGERCFNNHYIDPAVQCKDKVTPSCVKDDQCLSGAGQECSSDSECRVNFFCDNDTKVCKSESLRQQTPVLGPIGGFIRGVGDTAWNISSAVLDENIIGDLISGFGYTVGVENALSKAIVDENIVGDLFEHLGTSVAGVRETEEQSKQTFAQIFNTPECQAFLAGRRITAEGIRLQRNTPEFRGSPCVDKNNADIQAEAAEAIIRQGVAQATQEYSEDEEQRRAALKQVVASVFQQMGAGNPDLPPATNNEFLRRGELNKIAESLGLKFEEIDKWEEAQLNLFITRARRIDQNTLKAAAGLIIPVDSVENYGLAEDVCRAEHGMACVLRGTNISAYNEISDPDLEKLNHMVRTNQPNVNLVDFNFVKQYAASFGVLDQDSSINLQDPKLKADRAAQLSRNIYGDESSITPDQLDQIRASFEAYNREADRVRTTPAGKQMVQAELQAGTEVFIVAASAPLLGLGFETPLLARGLTVGRAVIGDSVKVGLVRRLGAEAGEETFVLAQRAMEKLQRRFILNAEEEAALNLAGVASQDARSIALRVAESEGDEETVKRIASEYSRQLRGAGLNQEALENLDQAARESASQRFAAQVELFENLADSGAIDSPAIRMVGNVEHWSGNTEAVRESLELVQDAGAKLVDDAQPVVVVSDPAQSTFQRRSGAIGVIDDLVVAFDEWGQGIGGLFRRGGTEVEVPGVNRRLVIEGADLTDQEAAEVERRILETVDGARRLDNEVLRGQVDDALESGTPVQVIAGARDDVVPSGNVAQTLDNLATFVNEPPKPVDLPTNLPIDKVTQQEIEAIKNGFEEATVTYPGSTEYVENKYRQIVAEASNRFSGEELEQARKDLLSIAANGELDGKRLRLASSGEMPGSVRVNSDTEFQRIALMELYLSDPEFARGILQRDIIGGHGSTSGSLMGVLEQGLKPQNTILDQGGILVSGERVNSRFGFIEVGEENVFFTRWYLWDILNRYSVDKQATFNEENIIRRIQLYKKALADPDAFIYEHERQTVQYQLDQLEKTLQFLQSPNKSELDHLRTALMQESFPVIYLTDGPLNATDYVPYSSIPGEFRMEGGVEPSHIKYVLVPENKVAEVEQLVTRFGRDWEVEPIESFTRLPYHPEEPSKSILEKVGDWFKVIVKKEEPCPVGVNLIPTAYAQGVDPCPTPGFFEGVRDNASNLWNRFFGKEEPTSELDSVGKDLQNRQVTPELIEFWSGTVRDTDGNLDRYRDVSSGEYHPLIAYSNRLDLNNTYLVDYLNHSLSARRDFLRGVEEGRFEGSVDDFRGWLSKLHTAQAYTGGGDVVRTQDGSAFFMGSVVDGEVKSVAEKYGDPLAEFVAKGEHQDLAYVNLPGISAEGRPVNNISGVGGLTHNYPNPEYFDEYLTQAQNRLIRLEALGRSGSDEELRLIAEVYQYLINSRMFDQGNNSLFMNMANGLLEQRGLKPVEHGVLDFAAFSLQPDAFNRYFVDEIKTAQAKSLNLDTATGRIVTIPCPVGFNLFSIAYAQGVDPCPTSGFFEGLRNTVKGWFDDRLGRNEPGSTALVPVTPAEPPAVIAKPEDIAVIIDQAIDVIPLPQIAQSPVLKEVRSVGPNKPMAYLSLADISNSATDIDALVKELETKGLTVRGINDSLFVYDPVALNDLIQKNPANMDTLLRYGWPTEADKFAARVATDRASKKTALYDVVSDAFGNSEDANRLLIDQTARYSTELDTNDAKRIATLKQNPYLNLTDQQRGDKLRQIGESYYDVSDEHRKALETVKSDLASQSQIVSFDKSQLAPDPNTPVRFNGSDQIEIKLDLDEKGQPAWYIRNKTIADKPVKPAPAGTFEQGTAEDVRQFIAGVNPYKIGTHKLVNIPSQLEKDTSGRSKVFVFRSPEGKIEGIAFVSDYGDNKLVHVNILAVDPDISGSGIGTAILSGLKEKYESLSLTAVPFGLTDRSLQGGFALLNNFYKQNGLVGASAWSRSTINLDDLTTAGSWQKFDLEHVYNIGIDNQTVSTVDVITKYLSKLRDDPSLSSRLSPETLAKLAQWDKANGPYAEVRHQMDLLSQASDPRTKRSIELYDERNLNLQPPCPTSLIPVAYAEGAIPCPQPSFFERARDSVSDWFDNTFRRNEDLDLGIESIAPCPVGFNFIPITLAQSTNTLTPCPVKAAGLLGRIRNLQLGNRPSEPTALQSKPAVNTTGELVRIPDGFLSVPENVNLIKLSEQVFPEYNRASEEAHRVLGDTPLGQGKYKMSLYDSETNTVTTLFKPDIISNEKNRKILFGQVQFYLKFQDGLENVAPITGLVVDSKGSLVGVRFPFGGTPLSEFGGILEDYAIEELTQAQARNINKTGWAHADLIGELNPFRINGGNILVQYVTDENGVRRQKLIMIDYHGLGDRVNNMAYKANDKYYMAVEPEWLDTALKYYNRLKKQDLAQ